MAGYSVVKVRIQQWLRNGLGQRWGRLLCGMTPLAPSGGEVVGVLMTYPRLDTPPPLSTRGDTALALVWINVGGGQSGRVATPDNVIGLSPATALVRDDGPGK